MELSSATNYAFGIPTNYIFVILGLAILGGGLYLYRKYKSK